MITVPQLLRGPMTVARYLTLSEYDYCRWELQEGSLAMASPKSLCHRLASVELYGQLAGQLPVELLGIQGADIDLGLARPDGPGTVRRPDLVVVDYAAVLRVDRDGALFRPDEVRLVVEIASPGARRTASTIKRREYADAGIGHYWIVDLDAPVSLLPLRLTGDLGYAEDGEVTGDCLVEGPFPIGLQLDELTR